MAIKRYTPNYKRLKHLTHILPFEKKLKIKKFKKQKWSFFQRTRLTVQRFTNRYKNLTLCDQNKRYMFLKKYNEENNFVRRRRNYKFDLYKKRAFQYFYGEGRLKSYQIKTLARKAEKKSSYIPCSSSIAGFRLLENRAGIVPYRLSFLDSLMEVRKSLACGIFRTQEKNSLHTLELLKTNQFFLVDPLFFHRLSINLLQKINKVGFVDNTSVYIYKSYKRKKIRRKKDKNLHLKKQAHFLHSKRIQKFNIWLSSLKKKLHLIRKVTTELQK
jgi:hypothetical protein